MLLEVVDTQRNFLKLILLWGKINRWMYFTLELLGVPGKVSVLPGSWGDLFCREVVETHSNLWKAAVTGSEIHPLQDSLSTIFNWLTVLGWLEWAFYRGFLLQRWMFLFLRLPPWRNGYNQAQEDVTDVGAHFPSENAFHWPGGLLGTIKPTVDILYCKPRLLRMSPTGEHRFGRKEVDVSFDLWQVFECRWVKNKGDVTDSSESVPPHAVCVLKMQLYYIQL